jgi:hypothetical protein
MQLWLWYSSEIYLNPLSTPGCIMKSYKIVYKHLRNILKEKSIPPHNGKGKSDPIFKLFKALKS